MKTFIAETASESVIDEAFEWLCRRRKKYSPHDRVWFLRRDWKFFKPVVKRRLIESEYKFSPVEVVRQSTPPSASGISLNTCRMFQSPAPGRAEP